MQPMVQQHTFISRSKTAYIVELNFTMIVVMVEWLGGAAVGCWTCCQQVAGLNLVSPLSSATLGKLLTHMLLLSPSSIIWYQPMDFRDKLSPWEPEGFRRRPGRPRQNWKDVVEKDLRKMGFSWDEVEEAAEDRRSWRNRDAQCVFDAEWTRNQELRLALWRRSHADLFIMPRP